MFRETSEKSENFAIMWTNSSHCILMADSIQADQPIRVQHLHYYTSRILLINNMTSLGVN